MSDVRTLHSSKAEAARYAEPQQAAFALVTDVAAMPLVTAFNAGTPEYPDRSATLFVQVDALANTGGVHLSGPGLLQAVQLDATGVTPLSRTLDHVGPLCRSVNDAAILLDVLRGTTPRPEATPRADALTLGVLRGTWFERVDPAVASAPLVATLVDVTGLIIYFTIAFHILHGTLL